LFADGGKSNFKQYKVQSAWWKLWKNIAANSTVLGKPEKFCSNI